MQTLRSLTIVALGLALSGVVFSQESKPAADAKPTDPKPTETTPAAKPVKIIFETTKGEIEIELNTEKAPISSANFLSYVKKGHFSDTIFHRVIPGFMIQGGGFTADMVQKPTDAPIKNEATNGLKNLRGTLSMARTSVVDSGTCQFFLNVVDNAYLDHTSPDPRGYGYAVFAKVTKGMDVADAIVSVPTGNKGQHQNVPNEPITIKSAKVLE